MWATNTGRAVPHALQQACFRRDHHQCQSCGYQGTPNGGDLNADHIHNRATGGQDTLANLTTLCLPCHTLKTAGERTAGIRRRQGRRRPRTHPADAYSKPHSAA